MKTTIPVDNKPNASLAGELLKFFH